MSSRLILAGIAVLLIGLVVARVLPPEQSRAQAMLGMPLTEMATHSGTADPPGEGTQSTAALPQPVCEQKPSIGFMSMSTD